MVKNTKGGFLISQIKQVQDRIFNRILKKAGLDELNGPHGRILFTLWREDNLPISELAGRTSLANTSITTMLDRMEAKGQIMRVSDKSDRRQTRIVLTEQAKALHERYQNASRQINGMFYQGFTDEEIEKFETALEKVLDNLKGHEKTGRN